MRRPVVLIIDLVAVIVFAGVGRASHDENILTGLARTAWPFLVACLVAWALVLAFGLAPRSPRGFLVIWPITALGGLLLRAVSGTSAPWLFWIVATFFLGVFLGGWRLIAHLIARRGARA